MDFWGIVGVGQFGLEEEFEVGVEGQVFTCEFEDFVSSFLDEGPGDHGHENGINIFAHIFDHGGVAQFDSDLKFPVDVLGAKTERFEFIIFFFLTDPRDTLQLRIDHEGVSF